MREKIRRWFAQAGAARITAGYILAGLLWLCLTAWLILRSPDVSLPLLAVGFLMALGFIVVSGGLIYLLARRQAARLAAQAEQYQLLAENVSDVIWVLDMNEGRFRYISPSVERLRGFTAAEAMNQTSQESLSPESWAYLQRVLPERIAAFQSGQQLDYRDELQQPRNDGSLVPIEVSSRFGIHPENGHLEVYATSRDISARREAEQALQAANQQLTHQQRLLTLFIENSPAAIAMFDREMRYIAASRRYLVDYNLVQQPLAGRSHYEIFPDLPERWKEIHRRCLAGAVEHAEEDAFPRSDGRLDWVRWEIHPWYEPDAEIGGVILFSEVITERKQAEQQIREMNALLEERVRERTAALRETNAELEAFTYSVSHDLRAPLRAIDGYIQILLEDYTTVLDEEGRRLGQVISREARRMSSLIDDLLNLSRLTRQEMRPERIQMEQLAQGVFSELATLELERELDLRLAALPEARGDPVLIRQVWINLLSNALKFSAGRQPAVIEVGSRSQDGETAFYVRDNGVGFDMCYADKLFGVFQRLHSEREFKGTGVGLAIVKRAVLRHGGRVWAESRPGEGACFYFTLPE